MTQLYFFYAMVDIPDGMDTNTAETIVAQGTVNQLSSLGIPGNVMVSLWKVYEGCSVTDFSPNSSVPTMVESFGTSTSPVERSSDPDNVVADFVASSV